MDYSKLSNVTQKWVYCLLPFTINYNNKYNASELERLTKIPQQTISRVLSQLLELNLIDYKLDGKNKNYYLNLNNIKTISMINIIENFKALDFNIKNWQISLIIDEILPFCDTIILFGSYSRGDFQEDSDLDLILINCKNKDKIKQIKNLSPIKIHEQYISYLDFKKSLKQNNSLAIEIKKNHILFGNSSKIINYYTKQHNCENYSS